MSNDEVLAMFRDYWSPFKGGTSNVSTGIRTPFVGDEKFEAVMAVILTFAKQIDPVPLAEAALKELEEFKLEMRKAKTLDRNAMFAIELFRSFRQQFLKKNQKARFSRFGRLL